MPICPQRTTPLLRTLSIIKKVMKLIHEEHALQMFLADGSAELLFSRMSTGTLRTADKGNKKTALESKKKWSVRIVFLSQSDDFSG